MCLPEERSFLPLPDRDHEEVGGELIPGRHLTVVLDPHADVIWGARVRKDMKSKIRVFAIYTGLGKYSYSGSVKL